MEKAIFKYTNNGKELLCSKCGKCIKLEKDFDKMTKFAADGVITLLAQYCDEHQYLDMVGRDRKREMLRRGIKEQLREGLMGKNVLDILITKPNQKLVIMRGIPGSGKSTKAKSLVGEGVIHSTDTLIEATGDYKGFFKKMIDSKDFSNLGKMHHQNCLNVKESMEMGVTPIILDNTNIKANEPKKVVEIALKLGYDENNITIVDVADGGVSVEVLAKRNTHGVPLDKIKSMVSSHQGVGPLTVKKILEAKDIYKNSKKILYSAVVLDGESKDKLLKVFGVKIPENWKIYTHHMTIVFGKGLNNKSEIGKRVNLTATHAGKTNMTMAVRVSGYPTTNKIPHITIAVNVVDGGKPFMSNEIIKWTQLKTPIELTGTVTEVTP
jgi:predicted kinase